MTNSVSESTKESKQSSTKNFLSSKSKITQSEETPIEEDMANFLEGEVEKSSIVDLEDRASEEVEGEVLSGSPGEDTPLASPDDESEEDVENQVFVVPAEVLNREASQIEIVRWVGKHLESELTQEIIDGAPSGFAISMLKSYTRSDARKNYFLDKYGLKMLPKGSDIAKGGIGDVGEKNARAAITKVRKLSHKIEKKRERELEKYLSKKGDKE